MKEPNTDAELEDAIKKAGYEFIDTGSWFVIRYIKGGGQTRLKADELSDALFEAYSLTKE